MLARLINSAAGSEFAQLNVVKFDGEADADDIIAACETLPVFSDYRVVICKDSPMLKDSEYPGIKRLLKYIDNVADTTVLVFFLRGTADARNALYKKLAQHCIVEFKQLKEREIAEFLRADAKLKGLSIQNDAIWKLIEYVGKDMFRIANEIEKAFCYIHPRTDLSAKDIETVVSKTDEANAFEVADLIFAGDIQKAARKLDILIADGAGVPTIIGAFAYRLRLIIEARMLLDSGVKPGIAVNRLKINPYYAKKVVLLAQRLSLRQFENMLSVLAEVSFLIRTGRMQEYTALKYAVARMFSLQ